MSTSTRESPKTSSGRWKSDKFEHRAMLERQAEEVLERSRRPKPDCPLIEASPEDAELEPVCAELKLDIAFAKRLLSEDRFIVTGAGDVLISIKRYHQNGIITDKYLIGT